MNVLYCFIYKIIFFFKYYVFNYVEDINVDAGNLINLGKLYKVEINPHYIRFITDKGIYLVGLRKDNEDEYYYVSSYNKNMLHGCVGWNIAIDFMITNFPTNRITLGLHVQNEFNKQRYILAANILIYSTFNYNR